MAVGDLNGDSIPDIVTANRIDDTVSVFLGNGDGTFSLPRLCRRPRVWLVTLADLNNDGRLDILTVNKGDNTISVLLGNGDGTFQPQIVIPAGVRPSDVVVADVNGDGKPDLIFSNYASDTIPWCSATAMAPLGRRQSIRPTRGQASLGPVGWPLRTSTATASPT